MTERFQDWETRLNNYMASNRQTVFGWKGKDCAAFACGAVQAQTGVDIMPEFRGRYDSKASAFALVKALGYPNLAAAFDAKLKRVPVSSAQRGDLVMVKGRIMAVVFGSFALAIGEDQISKKEGILHIPRSDWRKAWRVG